MGAAVIEKTATGEKLLFSDCIETNPKQKLDERLLVIGNTFTKLLEDYKPQLVGVETLFFNKNVKTAIGVAQARGIILYLAKNAGADVHEYGPQEIKIAVTGYGKSDKAAVIDMVKRLVTGVPEKALDDEYDAIATGITCLAHQR